MYVYTSNLQKVIFHMARSARHSGRPRTGPNKSAPPKGGAPYIQHPYTYFLFAVALAAASFQSFKLSQLPYSVSIDTK